ncbi:MAG: MFS transporter [Streptosporangiaceae bacterium]|nr:MFS transporter [Streptosporangiaceae bacterium]MBV9854952.1 MFS transporter [Streptosporangiaceae bacterium]
MISAGDGLAQIALASRVYERSHAGWAVAVVFLAITVPIVLLAPAAGLLLDKVRPKPVLVAAAAAAACVTLALVRVTGVAGTLLLAGGLGACAAVLQPGLGAIVPRLAPPGRITRANSYLQAATWAGMTAGPLLAGVLSAVGGTGLALAGNAATYALGAAGLALLRIADTDRAAGGAGQETMWTQIRAGLGYLRSDRTARLLTIVVGVMVAFAFLAVVAEVVLAQGVFHAGTGGYSVLVASWTAGMVLGTLAAGPLPRRWLVPAALLGTVGTGLGIGLAGLAPALWLSAAAYGIGGLSDGVEVLATRSYLNHHAPEALAGRVFALYSAVTFGAASAGMAAASGLLGPLGARTLLVIAGCGGIAAGSVGWLVHARAGRARLPGREHSLEPW